MQMVRWRSGEISALTGEKRWVRIVEHRLLSLANCRGWGPPNVNMATSRIRIREIADLANVSIGTVDRAFHARRGIREETRKKVLQIGKDLCGRGKSLTERQQPRRHPHRSQVST